MQNATVDVRRNRSLSGDHRQEFGVGNVEEPLILVDFIVGQGVDLGIGETAQNEIHFAHAAMPRAEQKLAAAGVEPFA